MEKLGDKNWEQNQNQKRQIGLDLNRQFKFDQKEQNEQISATGQEGRMFQNQQHEGFFREEQKQHEQQKRKHQHQQQQQRFEQQKFDHHRQKEGLSEEDQNRSQQKRYEQKGSKGLNTDSFNKFSFKVNKTALFPKISNIRESIAYFFEKGANLNFCK